MLLSLSTHSIDHRLYKGPEILITRYDTAFAFSSDDQAFLKLDVNGFEKCFYITNNVSVCTHRPLINQASGSQTVSEVTASNLHSFIDLRF